MSILDGAYWENEMKKQSILQNKKSGGRPFLPDALRRDRSFRLRLSEEEFQKLHNIAKEKGISISMLICETLDL